MRTSASADAAYMRQLIIGGVLMVWGLAVILNHFVLADGAAGGSGASEAGQSAAVVFAAVMAAAGGFTLFRAAAARRDA